VQVFYLHAVCPWQHETHNKPAATQAARRTMGPRRAVVPPDIAPCGACLAELGDPADRRHGYAFINCTDCGPRFTIIDTLPYDRRRTTMRSFAMCPACEAEYRDPASRRFHAQPNACPTCGPAVWFAAHASGPVPVVRGEAACVGETAIAAARAALRAGGIVAVKGVGGFHLACDDSVIRCVAGLPLPLRRSRGHAPLPIRLATGGPPVLAVGGELKATLCLARDHEATMSQHIGDLGSLETLETLERSATHLISLTGVQPAAVVADLHPGYASTRWAREFAVTRGIPCLQVQHHEAHVASLLAEHGRDAAGSPGVIGVCFDGTGYGSNGTILGASSSFATDHCRGVPRISCRFHSPGATSQSAIPGGWRSPYSATPASPGTTRSRLSVPLPPATATSSHGNSTGNLPAPTPRAWGDCSTPWPR
jgi:hydrogenase maturation factor HypF (carbamoyltransferase family)